MGRSQADRYGPEVSASVDTLGRYRAARTTVWGLRCGSETAHRRSTIVLHGVESQSDSRYNFAIRKPVVVVGSARGVGAPLPTCGTGDVTSFRGVNLGERSFLLQEKMNRGCADSIDPDALAAGVLEMLVHEQPGLQTPEELARKIAGAQAILQKLAFRSPTLCQT